jgi:hypothetical protein
MRKLIPAILCVLLLVSSIGLNIGAAQSTTPTVTPAAGSAANTSNVTIFFVACDTAAIMNLSGTMEAGYDVYYQVFSGANGSGTAITSLRRVEVNGAFTFSERIAYNSGATVAAGSTASARVIMARETDSSSTIFDQTVNDLQDGCANPQNQLGTSIDAGSGVSGVEPAGGSIRSPFGGFINNNTPPTPEPIVVIGARREQGRSDTPGVIFAECDQYLPQAAPGVIYDNDNITIFWSWFARTEQQINDHLAQAQYAVKLNRAPLGPVNVSPITRPTSNYWVFYTVNLGSLTPGTYGVEFRLNWTQAISDGYDDFGPGTDNEEIYSTCTFTVTRNPNNQNVTYNQMYSLR